MFFAKETWKSRFFSFFYGTLSVLSPLSQHPGVKITWVLHRYLREISIDQTLKIGCYPKFFYSTYCVTVSFLRFFGRDFATSSKMRNFVRNFDFFFKNAANHYGYRRNHMDNHSTSESAEIKKFSCHPFIKFAYKSVNPGKFWINLSQFEVIRVITMVIPKIFRFSICLGWLCFDMLFFCESFFYFSLFRSYFIVYEAYMVAPKSPSCGNSVQTQQEKVYRWRTKIWLRCENFEDFCRGNLNLDFSAILISCPIWCLKLWHMSSQTSKFLYGSKRQTLVFIT